MSSSTSPPEEVSWEYRNVLVHFPCQPYPSQRTYTERVLDCLLDAQNGLLESPTGSGKTLALLCASLAWRNHLRATTLIQQQPGGDAAGPSGGVGGDVMSSGRGRGGGGAKVFYASRTHSQLAQVMAELKGLDPGQPAVALGSRDQLCIHPAVRLKQTVGEKNQMCSLLVKTKQCEFYNNFARSEGLPSTSLEMGKGCNSVMDIEDLVKHNTRHKVCPYFKSRDLTSTADFIFLPYNYLLDRSIRKSLPVSLANSFVIVDEAHNVAKVCEESSSLTFDSQDVALAIHEVEAVIKMAEDRKEQGDADVDLHSLKQLLPEDISTEDAYLVKECLLKLEDTIAAKLKDQSLRADQSYSGDVLLSVLDGSGMDYSRSAWLALTIQQLVDALASGGGMLRQGGSMGRGMETVLSLLKIAYSDERFSRETLKQHYSLLITRSPKKASNMVFNLWCFHPGVAMRSVTECGTRSLVLTSGTLKPLSATAQELEISFAVQFVGPHIINKEQMLVRVVPRGIGEVELCSTFQNRGNTAFLTSLGRTIYELMRQVPSGMLIFFPSYSLMEVCVEHWKSAGVWDTLCQLKTLVVEPRDKRSFELAVTEFKNRVEDRKGNGACLLAVCRGKVAEGIDFSDSMARAVVVTGIPFPNTQDARIRHEKFENR